MGKIRLELVWLLGVFAISVMLITVITCLAISGQKSELPETPEVNPGSKYQFHQVIITAKEVEISNDLQNARFISKEITHLHEQIRNVLNDQSFDDHLQRHMQHKYSFPIKRQYWCNLEDVTLISDYFKLLGFKVEFSRVGEEDGKVGTFNLTLDR